MDLYHCNIIFADQRRNGKCDSCRCAGGNTGILTSNHLPDLFSCKDNITMVHHLFDALLKIDKREVILLKGHNVDFGAPIAEMINTAANGRSPGAIRFNTSWRTIVLPPEKERSSLYKDSVDSSSCFYHRFFTWNFIRIKIKKGFIVMDL